MDVYRQFFVDKVSRTFADTLTAFGLARVLADLLERQEPSRGNVLITDRGSYFHLTCSPPLEHATVETLAVARISPIPAIRTEKNAASLPEDIPALDYAADRERVNLYYAARKAGAENLPPLPSYWEIERAINPGALSGYNRMVVDWWRLEALQSAALELLLALHSATPNDYAAALAGWKQLGAPKDIKAETTCLQLYNPDQGKGQNKSKADGLSIGNIPNFWLVEWLKAVGFYEAALTRTVRGAKDRKTFVLAPRELALSTSGAVMSDFRASMSAETSTKFDILAALRYTQRLLEHAQREESLVLRLLRRQSPKHIVAGFDTAFYKDLGNAAATMNMSFIALPGWVQVTSRDDLNVYTDPDRGVLTELEKVARQFDESHSDAFTLLQHLRDFISGDDLAAFFRFTNAFAGYYISQREQNRYAYPLSTEFIERLIMSTEKPLSRILETPGFQNIAYAIRQSTVTAQYRKKQGDRKYDVRYGLGQELARKARYPEAFIAALSDFLHKYNAENAQVMETRPKPYRRSVKTSDIDDIIWLIDEYGSETVANLLIAYGYARVPRDEDESTEQAENQEETA